MTARAAAARPAAALYVHVPFCLSVCPYCDFVVYAGRAARGPASLIDAYLEAVRVEIRLRAAAARQAFGPLPALASVYVGGGTPSLLTASQVGSLLDAVDAGFGVAPGAEVTLELNPGPGDRGDLSGFRAAGVNRLSIGAQSMAPDELSRLGRRHSPADTHETFRAARAAGFANVSVDLLYDVPGQTLRSWRATLVDVLALEPDHVSAYALALDDPGSTLDHLAPRRGALRWRQKARAEQEEDRAAESYALADGLLAAAGLEWYELSNWSRRGFESRHNLTYWRWLPYEAVGPGAHAFDGRSVRRWNAALLEGYLGALVGGSPTLPPGEREIVDTSTAIAERAMLALRTRAGLPASLSRLPWFASAFAWARSAGLVEATEQGGLRLTSRGRLLASEVFWRLLPEALAEAG